MEGIGESLISPINMQWPPETPCSIYLSRLHILMHEKMVAYRDFYTYLFIYLFEFSYLLELKRAKTHETTIMTIIM